ncbi:MAG: GerMN domain-containing protein [Patescibacteria group bacterium]
MKNLVFIVAGLTIVTIILVVTFVYEPELAVEPEIEETPIDTSVVDEPEDTEPEEPVAIPEEVSSVKVFFSNSEQDPNTERCEEVYAVERDIQPTPAVAKEALDQLLAGVTSSENADGYFTNINAKARVVSVAIENGVATVVFSEDFENGLAGSCKVTSARAQVEETLKQFASVKDVIIKVEGVPDEEVLQP